MKQSQQFTLLRQNITPNMNTPLVFVSLLILHLQLIPPLKIMAKKLPYLILMATMGMAPRISPETIRMSLLIQFITMAFIQVRVSKISPEAL
jgi:hypothetical protein